MTDTSVQPDERLDLRLERVVDVPIEVVWAAWTQPEHLKRWFSPRPYTTVECEIDLRPGGLFRTVVQSPEGERFTHVGCYLEVSPPERLMWTTVLLPGYRPSGETDLPFTAVISLAPAPGGGTAYSALAMHGDPAKAKQHDEWGFTEGWGAALDQLVEVAQQLR